MMLIPEGILCSKSHEYLLEGENGIFTVGLTDYAVEQLGDIVFVELPEAGSEFEKGEVFATVESVKAASEIYMPAGGKIIEVNEKIVEENIHADSGDLLEYADYKEEIE